MSAPRGDIGAELYQNFIYVMGGYVNFTAATRLVERYDLAKDEWSTMPEMLFERGDMASGVLDGTRTPKPFHSPISYILNDNDQWRHACHHI